MLNIEALRAYIDAHGIKQTFVAKAAGLSANALSQILSGSRKCETGEFFRICDAIGANPTRFIHEGGSKNVKV